MLGAIWRICVIGVLFAGAGGCRNLRDGMPDDPLFIGRTPATAKAAKTPPQAVAYVEPEPPGAPLEMQDRPSLARYARPASELRTPVAPDVTRTPTKVPAILTNRPR